MSKKTKTKKVIVGTYGDKELVVEKYKQDYFWYFGKLCVITHVPHINEVDAEWLLRYHYDQERYKEINEKVEEEFREDE